MPEDPFPSEPEDLTPEQQAQWRADASALRDLACEELLFPLRLGDLLNQMKARWGLKLALLARQAGIPPHTAWQRARVAARIPPTSPLRALDLPYSILRLLAPIANPEPWAGQARALRSNGKLKVRAFARLLEDAGVRRSRPRSPRRRPSQCLQCGRDVPTDPEAIFIRTGQASGWLCDRPCALACLETRASLLPAAAPPAPSSAPPQPPSAPAESAGPKRDSGSQWFRCRFGVALVRTRPRSSLGVPPAFRARATPPRFARRSRRKGRADRPVPRTSRSRAPPGSSAHPSPSRR